MKYKLDDIDKKQGFKVPEGYFEDLPMKIQKRIEQEKPATRRLTIPQWGLALAASLALVFTFVFVLPDDGPSAEDLLATISEEELIAYLDQDDFDEYEIASAFQDVPEVFEFENSDGLDGLDLEDQAIEDVLLEYDLGEDYL